MRVEEQVKINGCFADIIAKKEGKTFLVEAKGEDKGGYTSAEMNFQMGLGQLMSRMKYAEAIYGLAFPLTKDFVTVLQKYQDSFAFQKLGIFFLPVEKDGTCRIIPPLDVLKFLLKITSRT